jgi:hypothetical protein
MLLGGAYGVYALVRPFAARPPWLVAWPRDTDRRPRHVALLRVAAIRLAASPEFRRLVVAIADELEGLEGLTGDDLRTLITSTEEAWNT